MEKLSDAIKHVNNPWALVACALIIAGIIARMIINYKNGQRNSLGLWMGFIIALSILSISFFTVIFSSQPTTPIVTDSNSRDSTINIVGNSSDEFIDTVGNNKKDVTDPIGSSSTRAHKNNSTLTSSDDEVTQINTGNGSVVLTGNASMSYSNVTTGSTVVVVDSGGLTRGLIYPENSSRPDSVKKN